MTTSKGKSAEKAKSVDEFPENIDDDTTPADDSPAGSPADAPAREDGPAEGSPASDQSESDPNPDADLEPHTPPEQPDADQAPFGAVKDDEVDTPPPSADHRVPWNTQTMGPPPPNWQHTYKLVEPPAPVPTHFTPTGEVVEPVEPAEF